MLGIGSGAFEKALGKTMPSISHPGGKLRVDAINYGRQVVQEMRQNGIAPTWENCLAKFKESRFAQYCFANSFVNDKGWHEKEANAAAKNAEYYAKQASIAAQNGNSTSASMYSSKAASYAASAKDHRNSASICTK